jgi:hypothetical protein
MLRNTASETALPQNQLVLYVSGQPPTADWQRIAGDYNWELLYHSDMLNALGTFVMLMPGIVVIDRDSAVGAAVLAHIEDVLHTTPQPQLIVIELGVPDCVARFGSVVRLGAAADAAPGPILSQAQRLVG